ncbi:molybdopterin dinucleotide-binding protein [Sulfolobus sp. A20]|uniref:molybdopterin dinucleotide binding domain-containing protein n=1 Tax=Saccharolobus sp. A20 TaxID=1891280 RepID=UPI000845F911|nr:molybdopterin dinucleotide binding domain-containing protein [Sulfolobus sp. A20]AOL17373.1 molybdopterin dinucleotide-binding protein [Sulfolobus sp. A20]TRM87058.1 molybdopterin dinucleotide-binding protein [Sulfolobus sp. C3]
MSSSSTTQYSPVPNRRIPLPPVTAERYHVTCRFCNVGCGYDVFVFPVGQEGSPAKGQNAVVYNLVDKVFNRNLQNYQADYTQQLIPLSANYGTPWIGEGMVTKTIRYNTNTKSWEEVYIIEVPSSECPANEGNYSTRGGRNAQRIWSPFKDVASGFAVYQSRITTPLLRWNNSLQPISWSYAIEAIATIIKYFLDNENFTYPDPVGPAAIQVLGIRADHGGGQGGGIVSNLMPGLFLHMGLATPFIRFHYQVAFSFTQDALEEATNGNGTDTASMLDISIADTLVVWGINEYVTSTVNLIQHIFDNISGATIDRKKQWFESGEPAMPGNIIIVEARPSETVHAVAAKLGITIQQAMQGITAQSGNNGGGYMLYVQVNPGTDAELANAVAAYIYYTYPDVVNYFINLYKSASTNGFTFNEETFNYYIQYLTSKSLDEWLSEAEQITGVPSQIIMQMGDLIAKPKTANGNTYYKRTLIEFEKGVIWSGNYTPIYAIANLAIISGALSGRPGCGTSTGFGHQRGAAFPLPPPPPWSSNLSQSRQFFIPMHVYAPQQLQSMGMTVNGTNIVNFIKQFYNQYNSTLVPQIYQYNPVVDYLIYSGYGKVLWVFTANPYKQTMSGTKLGLTIDNRARLLQECLENSASLGVSSSSTTTPSSSYNVSAVSQPVPSVPTPQQYASAVISCLGSVNGSLFVVGNDIILPQNGVFERAAHILLPSVANHGEIYELRWNGHDRRLRLVEAFHSPPGNAMPDVWIYSMIAYVIYQMYQSEGNGSSPQAQRLYMAFNPIWQSLMKNMTQNSQPLSVAPQFSENFYDYDWFSIYSDIWDYYVANGPKNFSSWPYGYVVPHWAPGWTQVSLSDLKMARTIGVQLPILGKTTNSDGSFTLWGLVNYAEPAINGMFRAEKVTINPNQAVTVGNTTLPLITREVVYISINDLQSMFGYSWQDLLPYVINGFNPFPTPYVGVFGYAKQLQQKYKYWVNNGRWNIIFQSGWIDYQIPDIYKRVPFPIIQMNATDAQNEGLQNGDIIQLYNDFGSLEGVVWISNTVPQGQVFVAMAYEVKPGANQLTTPTVDPVTDNQMVKWAWANIKKIGTLSQEYIQQVTFAPVKFQVSSS